LLIIPVLAGGVTGGEAVRKSLVLMDTMFMALAAGIWASAKGRGWLKRARAAVLMMGVIVLWPAIWEFHPVIWMLVGVCLLIFLSVWAASRKSSSVQNAAAIGCGGAGGLLLDCANWSVANQRPSLIWTIRRGRETFGGLALFPPALDVFLRRWAWAVTWWRSDPS
jgi:hypothetical protein